ncbi:flagellar protein FlaG [Desulfoluna butyratoxydans]|uniref:Flag protein n=1 Tax=Desulfoluna butyratoxydans TaxID=231438 RepID=A0A4U8YMH3_9BACT|nr:flagellar protein FlaG [Desulfoluna butyratoxydans]VFQ44724.1 flag protein [Desulfoluna butyratoxydans]
MMQTVSNVQPQMPQRRDDVSAAEPVRRAPGSEATSDNKASTEERQEKVRSDREDRLREENLSQETLDEISRDLDSLHAVGLNFTRHDETGRTMVRITNRDTEEVIREIPAKQVLDLAAKIEEMVGIIFDEKV